MKSPTYRQVEPDELLDVLRPVAAETIDIKTTPETPAVVVSTKGVSLADKLRLSELPLATTPGGKNFSMKALHPSEHTIKTARVPGGNKNSVALACDMVQTIEITDANSEIDVVAVPSILCPASITVTPPTGSSTPTTRANFYNSAFGGYFAVGPTRVDTDALLINMIGRISDYRITSQSVTLELVAPNLANQGTITCWQAPLACRTASLATLVASNTTNYIYPDAIVFPEPVLPSQGLLGTSAYTSKAVDGVYLPLKISSFKWRNFNDRALFYNQSGQVIPFGVSITPSTPLIFPYCEDRTGISTWQSMPYHPKLCGNNLGFVHVTGTAANVAVRIRVRQVVEITAPPGTTYAPLLEVALPPDETAMRMYFEISSRMKDGYPASYNDLGKLKDIITGLGKKLLPYVEPALDMLSKSGIPVLSTGATIGKTVMGAAKSIKGAVNEAKRKKPVVSQKK